MTVTTDYTPLSLDDPDLKVPDLSIRTLHAQFMSGKTQLKKPHKNFFIRLAQASKNSRLAKLFTSS